MIALFISLAIFLVFGATVCGVVLAQQAERKRRVMSIVRGHTASDNKPKTNLQDQRRSELSKKLKETGGETQKKKTNNLKDLIMQSGMKISVKQYWLFSVLSCLAVTFLVKVMGFSTFVVVMASITSLLGLPRLFLKIKIQRRQKAFMDDFADALESMMRLLKAGMPVSEAIKMVAREFSGPMGEEMEHIFDQQKIGVPLPEAVLEASKRMPLTEMQMFATAIAIQTQTGSSLSEVLQNLAGVIRSRFKLKRKVKALSSEAKASAMIIGALPVLVATGMYFINREYIEVLFIDPTGKFLLGCAIAWMSVGVLVMRQMINFKV